MSKSRVFFIAACLTVLAAEVSFSAIRPQDRQNVAETGLPLNPSNDAHVRAWKAASPAQRNDYGYYEGLGLLPPRGGVGHGAGAPAGLVLNDAVLNDDAVLSPIMLYIANDIGITPQSQTFLFLKPYLRVHKHPPADAAELNRFMQSSLTSFLKDCIEFNRLSQTLPYQDTAVALLGFRRAINKILDEYKYDANIEVLNVRMFGEVYEKLLAAFKTILSKRATLDAAVDVMPRDTALPLKQMTKMEEQLKAFPLYRNLSEESHRKIKAETAHLTKAKLRLSFIYYINHIDHFSKPLSVDLANLPEWTYSQIFLLIRDHITPGGGQPIIQQSISTPAKILKGLLFAGDPEALTLQDILKKDDVPNLFKKALAYVLLCAPLSEDQRKWITVTLEFKKNPFTAAASRREKDRIRVASKLEGFTRQLAAPPPPPEPPAADPYPNFATARDQHGPSVQFRTPAGAKPKIDLRK